MTKWLWILAVVITSYSLLCLLFYLLQERFIFHPEKLHEDFKYNYEYPFEEVNLHTSDGARINGLHFRMPNSKGVIIYFKGNTRSVKGWGKFSKDFISKGYDFFMIDYRGFGKSRGRRTEKLLYKDAMLAYKYLAKQYEQKDIVIYGRSIGSGFATYVASKTKPKMLILDSPYLSFQYIARRYAPIMPTRWLLRYKIRTDLFIKKVEVPIYIIHGTKDRLIPFKHAIRLASVNRRHTNLIKVKGAGHNNLPKHAHYHLALYDILHGHYQRASLYEEVF